MVLYRKLLLCNNKRICCIAASTTSPAATDQSLIWLNRAMMSQQANLEMCEQYHCSSDA
jgi:hypothetical protein